MSQFTRVNGDFLPLSNYDVGSYTNSGVNASASAATVQPQGPKLNFFTIELTDLQANGTITQQVFQTIEQLATVYIYEATASDTLAVAIYPNEAWNAVSLKTAIDTATGGTSTVTAEATFTN